jgi:histidinol phosphatase-like enzyme (inositol monophosphatase family)
MALDMRCRAGQSKGVVDSWGDASYLLRVSDPSPRELLDVALAAAWAGGHRTLTYFNAGVAVEWKADATPVTAADREAEAVIRQVISRAFPDHGILGEEDGETVGKGPCRWIIDPLDGTKSFVRGVPLYGTLIGVELRGEPVVGVIYLPALGETVAAARGEGCTWNGRPCRVSTVARLEGALVVLSDERTARARSGAFADLAGRVQLERTWGDCYGYALVATGRAEVALDPVVNVWDCAALLPIVEEAGGRFTDWKGRRTIAGGEAVATNGVLHGPVVDVLRRG